MNTKSFDKNKNSTLLKHAKQLRKNMTKEEKRLWQGFLRSYPIKIYKQRIIDNYIVDFYCHQAKLAIELDGSQHYSEDGEVNDIKRTNVLRHYGLLVLRFSNLDVLNNFDGVCYAIDKAIRSRI